MSYVLSSEDCPPTTSRKWTLRLGEIRRSLNVSRAGQARRMGISLGELERIENSGTSLKLSRLWRYAIALRISPDNLIDPRNDKFFTPLGNHVWLLKLAYDFQNASWRSASISVNRTVCAVAEQLELIIRLFSKCSKLVSSQPVSVSSFAGPYQFIRVCLECERTTIRSLAKKLNTNAEVIERKIHPYYDMPVSELEFFSKELGEPVISLLCGTEVSDPTIAIRTQAIKLVKLLRLLADLLPNSSAVTAEKFAAEVEHALEIDPGSIHPFPIVGQKRDPREISPLEERMCLGETIGLGVND